MLIANQVLLFINILALIWRMVLVFSYRPVPPYSDKNLPEITVVVPAYNEGEGVVDTLRSLAQSDYPQEKLHIIAVDDGSVDDTWVWMQRAAQELGEILELVHYPMNRGKRWALYEGFLRSKGEVIVTVDSDSLVDSDTLRCLVSPFIQEPMVGAVAGNVRIWNRVQGLIPRMLDVSFTYSFDFIRVSQNQVNTVMCTPGALSAYRREVVLQVLPQWLNQKFLGRPATIGEDRAMTNMILRAGYYVHFQRNANVYTKVPTTYRGLCKMFLRWARSNVRETLVLSSFAFRRFRPTSVLGARINLLLHWVTLTLPQIMRLQLIFCLIASPLIFGIHLMLGAMIISGIPAAVYFIRHRSTNALWSFPYGIFWLVGLSWITPYAILTPHKMGWLTRNLPTPRTPSL
jgi:hyaluronan synthase